MAPAPPTTPSAGKAPPSGPKSQRGFAPPNGLFSGGKLSIALPSGNAVAGPSTLPRVAYVRPNGAAKTGQPINAFDTKVKEQSRLLQRQQQARQQLHTAPTLPSPPSGTNGSRYSSGTSSSRPHSAAPSYSPPPPPPTAPPPAPFSMSKVLESVKNPRPVSPVTAGPPSSPAKDKSPSQTVSSPVVAAYRADPLPAPETVRSRVSIGLPPSMPNGAPRPLPPHMRGPERAEDLMSRLMTSSTGKEASIPSPSQEVKSTDWAPTLPLKMAPILLPPPPKSLPPPPPSPPRNPPPAIPQSESSSSRHGRSPPDASSHRRSLKRPAPPPRSAWFSPSGDGAQAEQASPPHRGRERTRSPPRYRQRSSSRSVSPPRRKRPPTSEPDRRRSRDKRSLSRRRDRAPSSAPDRHRSPTRRSPSPLRRPSSPHERRVHSKRSPSPDGALAVPQPPPLPPHSPPPPPRSPPPPPRSPPPLQPLPCPKPESPKPHHFRSDFRPTQPGTASDDESEADVSDPGKVEAAEAAAEPVPVVSMPSPPPHHRTPTPPPLLSTWPPPCVSHRKVGSFVIRASADGKREEFVREDGLEDGRLITVADPRSGRMPVAKEVLFSEITFEWNEHSVGKRPLPPPAAVCVTQLDPLTSVGNIRTFFIAYGKIEEMKVKNDPKTGGQLGICWVKFREPLDGKGKGGKATTAHDIAVNAVRMGNGQRVGMLPSERIRVVLDGRGLRAAKAEKDELDRKYPPVVKAAPSPVQPIPPPPAVVPPPPPTSAPPPLPTLSGRPIPLPATAKTLPNGRPVPVAVPLRAMVAAAARGTLPPVLNGFTPHPGMLPHAFPNYGPNFPPSLHTPKPIQSHPTGAVQQLASLFTEAPAPRREVDSYRAAARQNSGAPPRSGRVDTYVPGSGRGRSASRDRSPSRTRRRADSSSSSSSRSDSDSDMERPRERKPLPKRKTQAEVESEARLKKALEANGRPAVLVSGPNLVDYTNVKPLNDHFYGFHPDNSSDGFWITFIDPLSATKSAALFDKTMFRGIKLSVTVKGDHLKGAAPARPPPRPASSYVPRHRPVEKTTPIIPPPTAAANQNYVPRQRTVVAPPSIPTSTQPPSPAKPPTSAKPTTPARPIPARSKRHYSSDESDEIPIKKASRPSRGKSPSPLSSGLSDEAVAPLKSTPKRKRAPVASDEGSVAVRTPTSVKEDVLVKAVLDDEVEEPRAQAGKKRAAPAKAGKKGNKKARIASPAPFVEPLPPPEPAVAEIKLPPKKAAHPPKKAPEPPKKQPKGKKALLGPLEQLVADEVIEDEEDAYWLAQALAEAPEPPMDEDIEEDAPLLPEDHPLHHTSGAWRAQGIRQIAPAVKSAYLPQRNRAQAAAEASAADQQSHGLTTGRTARVTGRRLALDMETHRKTTASTSESDLFAFNQLRIRKKQLRFARSAIEGYGLYAMETIHPGEMVCEYVGELIRSVVADLREAKYLKQGIGSSYLFRIDGDVVCDATFRGSVSRLINHSCDPSASAKIITINGQSKIVIYAKRTLHPGEEILYDYLFPLESDPALRVPCLCGSKICRGFLN